jgi:polysaccharide export outer membrane protein
MSKQSLLLSVSLLLGVVILQQAPVSVYAKAPDSFATSDFDAQAQSNVEYRLKPKDLLNITIDGVCIYNPTKRIDDRGMIKMLLINEIRAAGRTATELERDIADKLNEYLKDPKVNVHVVKRRT